MKDLTCEKVLIAMMAAADGESAELSPEEMKAHLSACARLRRGSRSTRFFGKQRVVKAR